MLPRTCVVVPTYWTRSGGESLPDDAVYDHPTSLDGKSTLPPLLESLSRLDTGSFFLLLLVAVTGEDAADAAEERVRSLTRNYPKVTALVFGHDEFRRLLTCAAEVGQDNAASFLDLKGYPNIRNLQLVVPLLLGAESIVALDDDEVVTDLEFLEKATEPLGDSVEGRRVDGLSGHYLQEHGGIMLHVDPLKAKSPNLFDRKAALMNEGAEKLEEEPGNLVETPFCFGGNMEFSAELARSVGFDPGITRGEDIDYLINARMEGKHFFLRKDLRVLHLPPKGGSYKDISLSKLEQDIMRFIYELAKLRASQERPDLQPVRADELMPYPGAFLTQRVTEDAVETLTAAQYPGNPAAFVEDCQEQATRKVDRYLRFRSEWPRAVEVIASQRALGDDLLRKMLTL